MSVKFLDLVPKYITEYEIKEYEKSTPSVPWASDTDMSDSFPTENLMLQNKSDNVMLDKPSDCLSSDIVMLNKILFSEPDENMNL